jgi:DNA-binding NarL/FixJ family response regulator
VHRVRVVLVDDQEAFMHALVAVVDATRGFVVVGQASTGEESLELTDELKPGLVLMDVNLPGIDGIEATRRLRERGAPPVVILLSTHDEDAGDLFVAQSGANAYVTKSDFGPQRLSQIWLMSQG